MSLRVALYARVSTPNQTRTQTIEQQLERLQAHVEAAGWQLQDKHIFRDDGQSGASLNRPGLDQLRDGLRAGEVDHVLVTEPDRLARNYVHQMILLDELAHYGCQIEFLDRPLSADPQDKLLLQIRSAVAEYERELITDRMRRGRQAKYKAGVLLPWTRPPYGYRLGFENPRDPSQVRIEETEAAVIQEIFALYVWEGFSLCRLAKHLQQQGIPTPSGKRIWSLSTLRAFLRQPAYTGKVYANRTQYRAPRIRRSATHALGTPHGTAEELPPEAWLLVATIPAIITQEEFELAQKRLVTNKSFASRNNKSHPYLLRALVSCGVCQAACTAHAREGGKYLYYICSGKAKAIHSRREEKCPSRFAPGRQLDELVWKDLCELLRHPAHITAALERAHGGAWLPQELQARRQNLQQAQTHLQRQLDRLTEAYLASVIPLAEYQRRRQTFEEKMAAFALQEEQLDGQVDRQQELVGLVSCVENFCQRIEQGLDNATFEQKRQLVELLVDRVIVMDGDVEIRYVIPTSPASEHIRFCRLRSDYRHHLHPPALRLDVPVRRTGLVFPLRCRLVARFHPGDWLCPDGDALGPNGSHTDDLQQ